MRWIFTFLLALIPAVSAAADGSVLFESAVEPILTQRCSGCHGGGATLSGFDLTSRTAMLAGGERGVSVVPGDPEASRLYRWVAEGRMPMDGKLEPAEVDALRQWIEQGAVWGETGTLGATPRAEPKWWSLETVRKPPVPEVPGAETPIDAFVLERLRSHGLEFAPPADRTALLRRLSFDLHGLPPDPEALDEPYVRAVERLLASPRYGERWGRHWLDVARFGETDGGEHNNERPTAWKYRDYVIGAFNSDMPYSQFVREQIAGDVIAPDDPARVAATGFLVAGPWDSVTKRLNKDELQRKTIRQDELDDMVTATFAAFQGLTVNCARCHDHKFDPIPTRDYYRLTAVFSGAGFGERELATEEERKAYEALTAGPREELAEVREKLRAIEDPVRARLLREKYRAFDESRRGSPRRIAVNPVWNRNVFDAVTAQRFRFAVTAHRGSLARIARLELLPAGYVVENWTAAKEASADEPAYVEIVLPEPRTVSEIRWATHAESSSSDGAVRVYRFEYSSGAGGWQELCSSLDHIHTQELLLPEVSEEELASALAPAALSERVGLMRRRGEIQARIDAIEPLETVHAVKPEPFTPSYVLEGGSLARPLDPVTPGALSAVRQLSPELGIANLEDEGARRLALADWIADERNPLTARVMVNRVWAYHFGTGLVNTPSDFGLNGDRPSHPELLDYLAAEFMENGWSVKWLHRQILLSRTYRQSSQWNEKAHTADAGNRLLWRMPLKRMDAETLRDSILAVSGSLALDYGGPSFRLHQITEKGYQHKALDNDGPEVWRRAVYRFVVRGGERVFMDSFDCPDPAVFTPLRAVSNTPVQALTLLNSRFVLGQSERLAARLVNEAGENRDAQIARAYWLLFGRKPSSKETSIARAFLQSETLAAYCRVLLNSNEFVYVS